MPKEKIINDFLVNYSVYKERAEALNKLISKNSDGIFTSESRNYQISDRLNHLTHVFSYIESEVNVINDTLMEATNELLVNVCNEIKYLIENSNRDLPIIQFIINLNKYISTAQSIKIAIQNSENSQSKEFENLLKKYEETISKLEVNTSALDFKDTVIVLQKKAIQWKLGVISVAILLLAISVCFLYCFGYDFKNLNQSFQSLPLNGQTNENFKTIFYFELLKRAILRIFILSVIVYLLKFTIKNYNALMHNITVNQHKSNSLDAAVRMIKVMGIEDLVTRKNIADLASKEIFSQNRTGYLYKDENIDLGFIEKIISFGKKSE